MKYGKYISSSKDNFEIDEHLIEYAGTTWQVRNIAATKVSKEVIPFDEPEPSFDVAKPDFTWVWFALGFGGFIAIFVAFTIKVGFQAPTIAFLTGVGICGLAVGLTVWIVNIQNTEWKSAKARFNRVWKIWDYMRKNPPVVHKLMLETNAGSKPLFYSLEESEIARVNAAIKNAMSKKEVGRVTLTIEGLSFEGNNSIINIGSSIFEQAIGGR